MQRRVQEKTCHLFFYFENSQTPNFFWQNCSVNEFRMRKGGGQLGIFKKVIFIFKTLQKRVTKLGQLKKLNCGERSLKEFKKKFFDYFQKLFFFWSNGLLNEFWMAQGSELIGICKKNYSFYNSTKKGNKIGTIYKAETLPYISAF